MVATALASTSRAAAAGAGAGAGAATLRSWLARQARSAASSTARVQAQVPPRRTFLTAAAPGSQRGTCTEIVRLADVGRREAGIHTSAVVQHGSFKKPAPGTGLKVTFRDASGKDIKTVEANEGDDLLTLAHAYGIDLEGACEGSVACSTCHVILDSDVYDALEEPSDDENDMLDLAFGLTDTSRLGCQVKVTKETDGMVAQLPAATRNMYVDGHKPKPH
ncbi:unnamed protein product [Tilletia controversa]|nr:unnamed protein product [Tilletia controversa]